MSYLNAKSFDTAREVFPVLNVCARTSLLSRLDAMMGARTGEKPTPLTNCPEHLFSTDSDKMDAARRMDG
jgi:hypothetical protein